MFAARADDMNRKLRGAWAWLVVWAPDLVIALLGVWIISSEFPQTLPGDVLFDFGSFIASGQAAREGLNPYGIYPPLTFHFVAPGFDVWNLNPPISALLFQLFTLGEPHRMFQIWYAISACLYGATLILLLRRFNTAPQLVLGIWACAHAGVWSTFAMGNIYMPLLLLAVGAWLLLERGSTVWAGVLIGCVVAMKPNFAVWPVLLLLSGRPRPALVSFAVAAFVSVIPAAVLGVEVYGQWFAMLASDAGRAPFLTNVSLYGLAARAGVPAAGLIVAVLILAGTAAWAWWRRPSVPTLSAVAILATLLASPVAWVNYTLFLLPVVFANWRLPGMRWVAAGLMVTVGFITRQLGQTPEVQLTLGSIHAWSIVLLFGLLVVDGLRRCGLLQARRDNDQFISTAATPESLNSSPRSPARWAPWGPNVLLGAFALAIVAAEFPRTLPADGLLDFGSFYEAGQAAQRGEDPYGIYPLTFHVVIGEAEGWNPNLNPPISALLFQLFGLAPPHQMFRIWYCINLVVYATTLLLLLRRYTHVPRVVFVLSACAFAGFWETLVLGQIYLPLVLAAVGAWLLLERGKMVAAGVLIGLIVAIKPNFAVWPTLLFLSGRCTPALVAAAVALVISIIPAIALGPEVYLRWWQAFANDTGRMAFLTNASFPGLAARAHLPLLGSIASVLLLLASAAWAFFGRLSVRRISAVGLFLSVMASPIGWVNYTLFFLPLFCWRWSSPALRFALALLMVPVPVMMPQLGFPGVRMLTLGSVYNWAMLIVLGVLVGQELMRHRASVPNIHSGTSKPAPAR
jgi:hypothetical protein